MAEVRDWGEIRRLYEETPMSVAAIRERFGLSEFQLRQRREAELWAPRPPIDKTGDSTKYALTRAHVRRRLVRLIHDGLQAFDTGAAYDVEHARALLALARTWGVMQRDSGRTRRIPAPARSKGAAATPNENKNNDGGPDLYDDPVRLRALIAGRIRRIREDAGLGDAPLDGDA